MNKRMIAAGLSGNVLEWYDFAVYGYFAAVIGKMFFPADDSSMSLLLSLAVFAIGFLSRPLGSAIFGHLGDRIGRKKVLFYSTMLMAIPSTMIGLLPTWETIGVAAPVLLIVLRLLQGASVGGEYTGSVTYLAEQAPEGQSGFYGSWSNAGAACGVLLGSAVAALINVVLTADQVATWGWRIPFLMGSAVGIAALLLRQHMPDDGALEVAPDSKSPVVEAFKEHWQSMLLGAGIAIFSAINFYMVFVYLTTYMVQVSGLTNSQSLEVNTISMIVLVPIVLFGGHLGDRYGVARVMKVAATAMIVFAFPLFWLMGHHNPALVLAGQLGLACVIGPYIGLTAMYVGTLFPKGTRMSGLSVSYNVSFAVFGGTAPMVAHLLIGDFGPLSAAGYATVAAIVSLACLVVAERRQTDADIDVVEPTLATA